MNAFTKMVLIPEGEYLQLKSQYTDRFTSVLKTATPNQIKQNLLAKMINQVPKKKDKITSIMTSNLPKELKNELISKVNINPPEEKMEIDEFRPIESSTPKLPPVTSSTSKVTPTSASNFTDAVESIIDSEGQIFDSKGEIIPGSNINDLKKFISTPGLKKKRLPVGFNHVAHSLTKKRLKFDINNTQTRDEIEKIQQGEGIKLWSSLRKF